MCMISNEVCVIVALLGGLNGTILAMVALLPVVSDRANRRAVRLAKAKARRKK